QDTFQISALQQRSEELEKRLSEVCNRESTLHGQLQAHEDRERNANTRISELDGQLTRADDEIGKLKSDLARSSETEKMLRRVIEHLENIAKERRTQETEASSQISVKLADEKANLQARNTALTIELETSRSMHIRKIEELKEKSTALKNESEALKS